MKNREFRHSQPLHRETCEGRRHFADAAGEMLFHGRQGAPVVDRTEGLGQAVGPMGQQDVGWRPLRPGQEFGQKAAETSGMSQATIRFQSDEV